MKVKVSSRPKSCQRKIKNSPNYYNISIHEGLDRAKSYSDLVNNHFRVSQYQNHSLKSACKTYDNEMMKKNFSHTKTNSTGFYIKNPESQKTSNTESIFSQRKLKSRRKDPYYGKQHFKSLKLVLNSKTEKVPEYQLLLKSTLKSKQEIEMRIKELKKNITSERKQKQKISLECSKLMNERSSILPKTEKKKQELYNLRIQIEKYQKQSVILVQEIQQNQQKSKVEKRMIQEEHDRIDKLSENVKSTRQLIMSEQKEVGSLKQTQTVAYKSMTNNYMLINQFKQEKALLLNNIENSYKKNK